MVKTGKWDVKIGPAFGAIRAATTEKLIQSVSKYEFLIQRSSGLQEELFLKIAAQNVTWSSAIKKTTYLVCREAEALEDILVLWHASVKIIQKKMAGCGEIDHSINMLPTNRKTNESCANAAPSLTVPECAICLQTCVHPVRKIERRLRWNKEDFLSHLGMDALDDRFLQSPASSVRKKASNMDFRRKEDGMFLLSDSCQLSNFSVLH
ncbi:E3 ubiquitin-protein ligase RNF146 isoform A [Patagioenas fasciata monilis]|uniref:E3 ubiquitin-protein ligase RNF146 isoform A n=1 Tax=Patagioenas fasciata monilis TaxID=372326 RepID=A0A1V4JLQ2_PATFA|nr:E3 ubiquitin-protein ligase RNF146 isoform A [Patagioenas fasciata monilis]